MYHVDGSFKLVSGACPQTHFLLISPYHVPPHFPPKKHCGCTRNPHWLKTKKLPCIHRHLPQRNSHTQEGYNWFPHSLSVPFLHPHSSHWRATNPWPVCVWRETSEAHFRLSSACRGCTTWPTWHPAGNSSSPTWAPLGGKQWKPTYCMYIKNTKHA